MRKIDGGEVVEEKPGRGERIDLDLDDLPADDHTQGRIDVDLSEEDAIFGDDKEPGSSYGPGRGAGARSTGRLAQDLNDARTRLDLRDYGRRQDPGYRSATPAGFRRFRSRVLPIAVLFVVLSALFFGLYHYGIEPLLGDKKTAGLVSGDSVSVREELTLQEAVNAAADGDVIALSPQPYYGPLDFKGKSLTLVPGGMEGGSEAGHEAVAVPVRGATVTLIDAPAIMALLKGYDLVSDADGAFRLLYRAATNDYRHEEYPGGHLELTAEGGRLVVGGRSETAGQSLIFIIDAGSFEGEYRIVSGENRLFRLELDPQRSQAVARTESVIFFAFREVADDPGFFRLYYPAMPVNLTFSAEGLRQALFDEPLAYEGNAAAWNSYRDPARYLGSTAMIQSDDARIEGLAALLVRPEMSAYGQLVAIHHWVTTNIAYDVDYLESAGRQPQDALTVLDEGLAVCAGYANLMAALLRSQGISARYVQGYALESLDADGGWDEEGLYNHTVGHAWNEVYIDGEWITVDATWNAGYRTEEGFVFDQSFSYFAPTLELFSRSHFIPPGR